jgi:hypothetical protein
MTRLKLALAAAITVVTVSAGTAVAASPIHTARIEFEGAAQSEGFWKENNGQWYEQTSCDNEGCSGVHVTFHASCLSSGRGWYSCRAALGGSGLEPWRDWGELHVGSHGRCTMTETGWVEDNLALPGYHNTRLRRCI